MGRTTTNGDSAPGAQERAREGVEHLQAAVRELIEAARAALDVAEELVNDPESVSSLAGALASMGDVAKRVAGGGWPSAPHAPSARPAPPPEAEPRVQRITVT